MKTIRLEKLWINNFRSYQAMEFNFHPRLNFFYGQNAQGKTNLLEAVHYLSTLKSFRMHSPRDLIAWDQGGFFLEGSCDRDGISWELKASHNGRQREIELNGNKPDSLSTYLEKFLSIPLIPEHIQFIHSSPSARRALLDRSIFLCEPGYLDIMQKYNRVIKQKNALLKQAENGSVHPKHSHLSVWNQELAGYAQQIVEKRLKYIDLIKLPLNQSNQKISQQSGQLSLDYNLSLPDDLSQAFDYLEKQQAKEILMKRSLFGPHRDQVDIILDGRNIKTYGSQGQKRSFLIAYRLSEMELVEQMTGYIPCFLVDDLGVDLDKTRTCQFLELVIDKGGQIFISSTEEWILSEANSILNSVPAAYKIDRKIKDGQAWSRIMGDYQATASDTPHRKSAISV